MKPVRSADGTPVEVEPGLFGIDLIDGSEGARGVALLRGWLEPDARHSPHTHEAEEAVTILSGRGIITVGGVEHAVSAGDSIWFPPGVVHGTWNNGTERLEFIAAFSDALVDAQPEGTGPTAQPGRLHLNRARWMLRRLANRLLR